MIFYDLKSGLNPTECHKRLPQAFNEQAPSYITVKTWFKSFRELRTSHEDAERKQLLETTIRKHYMN